MKCPKGEIEWVVYHNSKNEPCFLVTSKENREYYFLYKAENNVLTKLGKARTPSELEKKFNIIDQLGKNT